MYIRVHSTQFSPVSKTKTKTTKKDAKSIPRSPKLVVFLSQTVALVAVVRYNNKCVTCGARLEKIFTCGSAHGGYEFLGQFSRGRREESPTVLLCSVLHCKREEKLKGRGSRPGRSFVHNNNNYNKTIIALDVVLV